MVDAVLFEVRMFAQRFTQYVITTSLLGGSVGIAHVLNITNQPKWKAEAYFYYGISGLVLGPWFPIVVPAAFLGVTNTACPALRMR